jgi:hypothetical protein
MSGCWLVWAPPSRVWEGGGGGRNPLAGVRSLPPAGCAVVGVLPRSGVEPSLPLDLLRAPWRQPQPQLSEQRAANVAESAGAPMPCY